MNERIKELAEQAAKGEGWGMEVWQTTYSEKFAELIIQECVESIPADGHRGDFGRAVEFCQQQIKHHFGVTV